MRQRMVDEAVIGAGVSDERVIQAMRETPRHEFLPRRLRKWAYEDMSLPIGERQTISSPFIVAFMTEVLQPQPADRVLEIGTGSGYQAAVLSHLVQDVYTIEIVEPLGRRAARTLQRLRYTNVHTKIGDGFQGWPEQAPFDKIIVTCSPENVPAPLVQQLKDDGIMVIPVGQRYRQTLTVLRKRDGRLSVEALRPTLFVPMTGRAEERRQAQPDPIHPRLANAGFEKDPLDTGFLPDWYYQRQVQRVQDAAAPQGNHYVTFANSEPGRPAHAMQGVAIAGRDVPILGVSFWVKTERVAPGRNNEELPAVVITFYGEDRAILGHRILGPFRGSAAWQQEKHLIRVPVQAREAIVRIGLFGAVGRASFDDVQVESRHR
jgi:protein-L-isoaspartate(D-aspartate) O-methyltransferase